MLPITTSTSGELFSCITIQHRWLWKTLNSQNKEFYCFSWFSAVAHTFRVNCNEMVGDRLIQLANRNCYRFSHISWALAQISCKLISLCLMHSWSVKSFDDISRWSLVVMNWYRDLVHIFQAQVFGCFWSFKLRTVRKLKVNIGLAMAKQRNLAMSMTSYWKNTIKGCLFKKGR